jgi:hypothetical protein
VPLLLLREAKFCKEAIIESGSVFTGLAQEWHLLTLAKGFGAKRHIKAFCLGKTVLGNVLLWPPPWALNLDFQSIAILSGLTALYSNRLQTK